MSDPLNDPHKEQKNNRKPFARRKLRGMGLTDSALQIGLFVLALVLILSLFNTILKSYRATNHTILMTQLTTGIQRAYASSASFDTGNLIPVLDGGGDIPGSARVDTSGTITIKNPYGGAVTVVGANGQVTLTTNDVPQKGCESYLTNFVGLNSDRTDIKALKVGSSTLTLPITALTVASSCVSGANTIEVTY